MVRRPSPVSQARRRARPRLEALEDRNLLSASVIQGTVFEDLKATQAPRHEHRNTIASVELLMQYNALPYARRIRDTPTLMITAEGDDITLEDLEFQAFNEITTPVKRLLVLPETSHMTLYSNVSRLEIAARAARDWYVDHLVNRVTPDRLLAGN